MFGQKAINLLFEIAVGLSSAIFVGEMTSLPLQAPLLGFIFP